MSHKPKRRSRRAAFVAALLACTWGLENARAEPPPPAPSEQLKAVEQNLEAAKAEKGRLAREKAAVAQDLKRARQRKIALAKDVQEQEQKLLTLENKIAKLEEDVKASSAALARRDDQMRSTLLALERMALRPGDALTLTPLAPEDAVRTAILLSAVVPEIASSTAALQEELANLYHRRAEIAEQRRKAAAAAARLTDKRAKLEAVIETAATRQTTVAARSKEVETRMSKLAHQAKDLRALFEKLAAEKAKRKKEEAHRRKRQRIAPPDDEPTRRFSKARGTLPFPAVGKVVARYGESGEREGHMTKGIVIATRTAAPVVSPYDGVVVFAGPFRGYGKLLIIEHSEVYHTLMAGMARIDGAMGQRLLAGEPVGVMADAGEPTLYVELRRDGQPINPLPWLASRSGS